MSARTRSTACRERGGFCLSASWCCHRDMKLASYGFGGILNIPYRCGPRTIPERALAASMTRVGLDAWAHGVSSFVSTDLKTISC